MKYRRFGKTEMRVSVITLGLMRYMSDDPDASAAVVHRAVELGINHLETARGYGNSEELLGYALQGLDRSKLYITTKIGPRRTYDEFMQLFETSMSKLRLDWLDNLDIHGINNEEKFAMALDEKGTWKAVRKLLDEGVVKHIGFSTHGDLPIVMKTIETGLFESVNLHYYWFYQRLAPAVKRAAELDMGVFIISPNDKGGMLFKPPEKLLKLSEPFHPMYINARWLLSQPEVHTLSLGAAVPGDFDLHMRYADLDGPLTEQERQVLQRWERQWREALDGEYCTGCYRCLPCPEFVNIPEILRLRNMTYAFDMLEYGRYRYNMLSGSDDWTHGHQGDRCTECGECLPRCPEGLDIPRLLFDAHDVLKSQPGSRLWSD